MTGPGSAQSRPRGPVPFFLGDVIRLRRAHPCGGWTWRVDRLGADLGLRCLTCGRHVLIARAQVERRLLAFESRGDPALSAALAPVPRDADG